MLHPIEEKIIQLIQKKDNQFVSLIYDNYANNLFGIIYTIINDEAIAQDVLQDAFVKIWKNADRYDPKKARLFTWLLAICRNTAIDRLRSIQNQNAREIQMDDSFVHIPGTSNIKPQTMDINELLAGLDLKYREVIQTIFFHGFTQQEASKHLDIPLGTVKTRLKIGLRELRSLFGNDVLYLLISTGLWQ